MADQSASIISKVWGMCGSLWDDGVFYGDYLEQLTYLIFLKMSDVRRVGRFHLRSHRLLLCEGGDPDDTHDPGLHLRVDVRGKPAKNFQAGEQRSYYQPSDFDCFPGDYRCRSRPFRPLQQQAGKTGKSIAAHPFSLRRAFVRRAAFLCELRARKTTSRAGGIKELQHRGSGQGLRSRRRPV